ncbi:MAG TPA: hypothetical protein VMX18_04350 [Candidatus Bipolaricaulota bacterium]|nr:hypothetical protein [Candidatus Bipolaricaulota bacterium]
MKIFKNIFGLILLAISGFYAMFAVSFIREIPLFNSAFGSLLWLIAILGLLGVTGLWTTILLRIFQKDVKKPITKYLIYIGIVAALTVSVIGFSFFGLKESIIALGNFMLSWGLLLFSIAVIVYLKFEPFRKKK